ncbi:hypothetical protein TWF718_007718 [Orbilia javanica]|uniref:F-box domain-containing protein n=1 Tax=Orbilia javanica TaxID=47235 RepID=A0AAN8MZP9_9PEZI
METISASPPFLDLPNEIHVEIFKNCAVFKEAANLAATCQQLQSIWRGHHKAVISHIGSRCMVAFDDALRAVRAIDMAERQYQTMVLQRSGVNVVESERPPKRIPIHRLGARHNPPSIDEMVRVFDLQYFIEVALFLGHEKRDIHIFCQQSSSKIQLRRPCRNGVTNLQPGVSPEEVNFKVYASMYRFFLVSAVLSSVYWGPFFADHPKAAMLRMSFAGPSDSPVPHPYITKRAFRPEDVAYIRRWACYNKRKSSQAQLDEVFGELGEYLVERGRREAILGGTVLPNTQQPHNNDRDIPTAGAVQAIMMIIGCHELFWCFAQQQLNCAGRAVERRPAWLDGVKYKRIPVTFLGIHGALDACIPWNAADISRYPEIQLLTRPVGTGSDGRLLTQVRLLRLFHELMFLDQRDGSLDSDLPYELGFFEYVLKKHFRLRVQFSWGYNSTFYSRYLADGTAFRGAEPFRRDIHKILSSSNLQSCLDF